MTGRRVRPAGESRAAVLVGVAAAFVAAVDLVRLARPALLLDADASWTLLRLLLWLGVGAGAGAAGIAAAALFRILAGGPLASADEAPVPFRRGTLAAIALGALVAGAALRLCFLDWTTRGFFQDHISLVEPTLALSGTWRDFADAIRPVPFGVKEPFGVIGVLYLEAFRWSLHRFGVTVFGIQFLSAASGTICLATAGALGRRLLPQGGSALSILALAGMRWPLILSQWGYHGIAVTPVLDVASLAMIASRQRDRGRWAAASGLAAGVAAHVYLSAWIGAAALALFAAWPGELAGSAARRLRRVALFAAGFTAAAAPLFLLRDARSVAYFERPAHHSAWLEIRRTGSPLPPFAAAADALVAPWFLSDPIPRHDLPQRTRLGPILGAAVGLALLRALLRPGREVSAFLLSQAGAAFAAAVAGGQAFLPHGFRFAYLSTVTAVAAAAGVMALLGALPESRRRAGAIAATGLLALSGALGARDAILAWPARVETFEAFAGQDYLIGRAAARWEDFGAVRLEDGLGFSPITIGTVFHHRIGEPPANPRRDRPRGFRVAPPGATAEPGERVVERVDDPWGRPRAVVFGRRGPSA